LRAINVESTGRVTARDRMSCTPLTPLGLSYAKQRVYTGESIRILSAYSVDTKGRKHDAIMIRRKRPDGITASGAAFPNLAIGEQYVIETEHESTRDELKRGLILGYDSPYPLDDFKVTVSAPIDFVEVDSADFGAADHRKAGERETWSWHARGIEAVTTHVSMDAEDIRPRVAVSFGKDFASSMQAIAQHYAEIEARSAQMRSVAQTIAKPGDSPRQKAQAALTWIQKNIAYTAAPEFVDGTLLPSDVDATVKRGKGMCRDLVAAYGALLRELNVPSEPVFVNTRSFWQPRVSVTQRWNHIVTYLPGLDLIVDPSDRESPLGMWNFVLANRHGYNIDQQKWLVIPYDTAWQSEADKTEIHIDAKGRARATSNLQFVGQTADAERSEVNSQIAANTPDKRAAQLLKLAGIAGQGNLRPLDSTQPEQYGYDIRYAFDASAFLPMKAAVPVPRTPSLNDFFLKSLFNRRYTHTPCVPQELDQQITVHWPAGWRISRAPKPMRLANSAGVYESTYTAKGGDLMVTRSFRTNWQRPICDLADADALDELEAFIAEDRAQTLDLASVKP
jgi:hypothetical protein